MELDVYLFDFFPVKIDETEVRRHTTFAEIHLVSMEEQSVNLDGETIYFKKGETIWTESSYKYTLKEFEEIANTAGFQVRCTWTDERQWFSVQYLETTAG